MKTNDVVIDSSAVGMPARFRSLAELERGLEALPGAPPTLGRVALFVTRGEAGRRQTPERVRLRPGAGVAGDAWERRPERNVEMQIAVMQRDIAELIANGQPLTLFGDNLFLDLDLSTRNLPVGSRVRAGSAILEVTPVPHDGCRKFRARFGDGALEFVSKPELRHRNFRGIYLRVTEGGEAGVGDTVEIVFRSTTLP
jgi:hypothetical protein